ncbi:MAG TPA: sigma-54-dependent Fis family transcriptional regulator [Candidatus Hydrogenedentes bacterium]|nr:sigma-54-dependent Fis family transcriptional regulator [Candidatus Hydrogenedentota bacterium]
MPDDPPLIAIVDDERGQRQLLDNALRRAGFRTVLCKDAEEGFAAAGRCDLLLLDVRMPGMSGLEVLKKVKEDHPTLPVILLTAFIDVRDAVSAMRTGALDYLEKPVDLDELVAAVDDALGCTGRPIADQEALELPSNVAVANPDMVQVFKQAARAAATDATILILGESGTGKQIVAEFVQEQSRRADKPFVTVNCGAIPEHLIESELFGHEKGAFTGADAQRIGRFEEADGGTLFLDEVGELPLSLQPAFLQVLETGTLRRVGGSRDIRTDIRIISATNRDLEEEVKKGAFREDLYYRLSVFPLSVPPLRARPEDILPLADLLLKSRHKRLSPAAERMVMLYDWPGNVRELRNALERASILSEGPLILPQDLPSNIQHPGPTREAAGGVLVGNMQEIQRQAILEALEKTGGNKTKAAKLLGIGRRTFIYKLRDYGM